MASKKIHIVIKFGSISTGYDDFYGWDVIHCAFRNKEKAIEYIHKDINDGKLVNYYDEVFKIDELPTEEELTRPCGWTVGPDNDYAGYRIEEVTLR